MENNVTELFWARVSGRLQLLRPNVSRIEDWTKNKPDFLFFL